MEEESVQKEMRSTPVGMTRREFLAASATAFVSSLAAARMQAISADGSGGKEIGGASNETLLLSGSDWLIRAAATDEETPANLKRSDEEASRWIPSVVPGNVQADLERNHVLQPLWYGAGDPRLADVAKTDWWYRKEFSISDGFQGKRLKLIFDGVDFECEVWLNTHHLGVCTGQFRRFAFDVEDFVKLDQKNTLEIRIRRMP